MDNPLISAGWQPTVKAIREEIKGRSPRLGHTVLARVATCGRPSPARSSSCIRTPRYGAVMGTPFWSQE